MLEAAKCWIFETVFEVIVAIEGKSRAAWVQEGCLDTDVPLAAQVALSDSLAEDHGSRWMIRRE